MARHRVIASAGAANSSAQDQPNPPRRSVRLLPSTEGLQHLQSRVDVMTLGMSAVGRDGRGRQNCPSGADF